MPDTYEYNFQNPLYNVIVNRNLKGMDEEKANNVAEAIKLYEANIYEPINDTPYPFKRLAILYSKNKDYDNEIRVLKRALEVFKNNKINYDMFKDRLDKLVKKRQL